MLYGIGYERSHSFADSAYFWHSFWLVFASIKGIQLGVTPCLQRFHMICGFGFEFRGKLKIWIKNLDLHFAVLQD